MTVRPSPTGMSSQQAVASSNVDVEWAAPGPNMIYGLIATTRFDNTPATRTITLEGTELHFGEPTTRRRVATCLGRPSFAGRTGSARSKASAHNPRGHRRAGRWMAQR